MKDLLANGCLIIATACAALAPACGPNVVLILADDLGWSDLGCYGSTFHHTPRIDALATDGLRFTNAYSASPLCSPTRASIMTGLHPARIGITAPVCHLHQVVLQKGLAPSNAASAALNARSVTRLRTEYFTLAEAFRDAGYRTAHFGKWHLGPEPYSPFEHGFDVDVPHMAGPGPGGGNGYFAPWAWWPKQGEPGEHIDDRIAQEAATFLRGHREQPFYLNLWLFGVHSPWMGKPNYIAEAEKRARPQAAQRHPVYAAMLRSTDDAVGVVLDALDEVGLAKDTIVIFASDNGAWHNVAREATNDSRYAETPVTSNAPLRSGKASLYEGGTRTPLIVRWPGVTAPGATTDALWQSTDFFPTLADACKLPIAESVAFDGVSQAALLRGDASPRETIFCHFPHTGRVDIDGFIAGTSVRRGEWKLCRFYATKADRSSRLELYNLQRDPGETDDVAAAHPELVGELNTLIDEFLSRTEAVVPVANPKFGENRLVIGGWSAQKDAFLDRRDGASVGVRVTGGDPILLPPQPREASDGPHSVSLSMRTTSQGPAELFWGAAPGLFSGERRVTFSVAADGIDHRYSVELPTDRLGALRFDPGKGPGDIVLHELEVRDRDGHTVVSWP